MAQNALQEQRIKELEAALKQQQSQLMELEEELDKKNDELHELDKSISIKVFGKVRGGQRGATSLPLLVWELIMEQLVNGTPPTSVNANILSFVRCFSPMTIIKKQPSIWAIRHRQTVHLVVVETLVTYWLAKAK
jgi:hypothetical protein